MDTIIMVQEDRLETEERRRLNIRALSPRSSGGDVGCGRQTSILAEMKSINNKKEKE